MNDLETIDAPDDLKQHVSSVVQWSQANAIATSDDFAATGEHLKQIKAAQKQANEFFDGPIKSAHELHKMLVGRKKIITDPLTTAESLDKSKMITYQQAEQRKAEDERRKAQAVLDAQAAAERAKIEEAARKQREIEAEQRRRAEESRRLAEQAGAEERKKLMAEAAKADAKADKAAAQQEVKAEQAAAVFAPVVAVQSAAVSIKGISTPKVWHHRITDLALLPREYMLPDTSKLEKLAKALKQELNIPGCVAYYEETMSARGR